MKCRMNHNMRHSCVGKAKNNIFHLVLVVILGISSFGCSRDQDEVYKDPSVNPEAKVGQQVSEQVEPADLHEGRYSVHRYTFKGKGPTHRMADVRRLGLEHSGSRGSDVSAEVYIEWPEEQSGLTEGALAKVRKIILWMAFASEATTTWEDDQTPVIYIVPEALGETEAALKSRIKVVCAEEGYTWEDSKFGLSPADWCRLTSDTLSKEYGSLHAKDISLAENALQLALSGIKRLAKDSYECGILKENHICSQWSFVADLHLDWPFGMKARDGAAWYERPVICVWNNGYSNDGGNGCHSSYCSKIYSLPDGRELDMVDFFSADKLKDLSSFVTKRLCRELLEPKEAEEMSKNPLDLDEAYMLVSMDGVKWTWDPYSILPGCYGTPSVFIKWNELEDFK